MHNVITLIVGVVSFGTLVLIHELGHFLFAIKANVHVSKFGIGMGPCIYKKVRNGIEYRIGLFPIGGYVEMPEETDHLPKGKIVFREASLFQKIKILMAGSVFNIIFGMILIFVVSLSLSTGFTTKIEAVGNEIALDNGYVIMANDTILQIDGINVDDYTDFIRQTAVLNEPKDVVVSREGKEVYLPGVRFGAPANSTEEASSYGVTFHIKEMSIPERINSGIKTFTMFGSLFLESITSIVSGEASIEQFTGPVGITKMIGESAQRSLSSYGMLFALIAINIGAINLMPLPALDGSRVVIAAIEKVSKKKIPHKAEEWIHSTGFLFLIGLLIVITFNDVINLVG